MTTFEEQLKKLFKDPQSQKKGMPSSAWLKSSRKDMRRFMKTHPMPRRTHTHNPFRLLAYRPVSLIAGLLIVVIIASSGMSLVAQGAEPGDTLYPVKLAAEKVTIVIAVSPEAKAELHMKYADRRIGELEQLYIHDPNESVLHEQVAHDLDDRLNAVNVQMYAASTSPEYADLALKFEELTRRQAERMAQLEQQLNTTTIYIINHQQEQTELQHQHALDALQHAQEMFDEMDARHRMIQQRLDDQLQQLRERQQIINERLNHLQQDTEAVTHVFDDTDVLEDLFDINTSTATDEHSTTTVYTITNDDGEVSGTVEVTTSGNDDHNVQVWMDDDGGVIINSSVNATGSSVRIDNDTHIESRSTQRIRINGEDIRFD